MIDKINYENIKTKKKLLSDKYLELNKLQQDIYIIKEDIKKNCKHDLLLVYDISYDYQYHNEEYRKAYCLVCDEFVKLNYTFLIGKPIESVYYRYVTKERIDNDNIIDATKYVPEEYRNYYVSGKNELIIEAQAVLDDVLKNNIDITSEDLKEIIVRNLIEFYFERTKEVKKLLKKGDKNE